MGAFVDNELRGVANASQLPLDFPVNPGSYLFLMLIYIQINNIESTIIIKNNQSLLILKKRKNPYIKFLKIYLPKWW